jgi:hypothetical protein
VSRRQIDPEELHPLFALIGSAIWHLQHVENVLAATLTLKHEIKTRGSVSPEEGYRLLAKHGQNTLGKSLRIAREAELMSPGLLQRLAVFKEERDWLVHRSVREQADEIYTDEGRDATFSRIETFSSEARALHSLIASELETFVVAQGATRDWILARAHDQLAQLRGERSRKD